MRNIDIICFSLNAYETALNIRQMLEENFDINVYSKCRDIDKSIQNLNQWTRQKFYKGNIIIFICAVGIAVRAISPFIKNKLYDAAVIVIDEKGKFVIPLLCGHVGGANEISEYIARKINAVAVITTATDINNVFAVDLWAAKNNFIIENKDLIKIISADLINNKNVGVKSDFNVKGHLPKNIIINKNLDNGFYVGYYNNNFFKNMLKIVPKCIVIGIGCKKGTTMIDINDLFIKSINKYNININAVDYVVSVDIKKDELGLNQFCNKYNFALKTYNCDKLNSVEGEFSTSEFVKKTIGTDNVCERACVVNNNGKFIMKKQCYNGVTMAIFLKNMEVSFDE